jgi:hypothetical protein
MKIKKQQQQQYQLNEFNSIFLNNRFSIQFDKLSGNIKNKKQKII